MDSPSSSNAPAKNELGGAVATTQFVSEDSPFAASRWNLSSHIHLKNIVPAEQYVDFGFDLPDGSLLTDPPNAVLYISTKEFCFTRLQGHANIPAIKARTLITTEFRHLRRFIRWMVANEKYAYSHLCPHHIEIQFLNYLRGNSEGWEGNSIARSECVIARNLYVVQLLWKFRGRMCDSLTFNPFNGKLPSKVLGVKLGRDEQNKTPVIPDAVMAPLANAALDYVNLYSNDIIYARTQIESVRESLEATSKCVCSRGIRGNIIFGARHINQQARAALMSVPISQIPSTGKPWREPFLNLLDLYREENFLFTACYIVTAWLTGMRDSEITSLRGNCVRSELSQDGVIERYKVKGTLFKGVPDPKGREETWVTIEPAAKALDVLTRLTAHLRARTTGEVTELFLRGERRGAVTVLIGESIRKMLNTFAEHINIPLVDGVVWKLCPRQFRRTLARWIGRRPFGKVAGKFQYKHVLEATFEGYMARDPEFNDELAEEQFLANIDLLEELKRDALEGRIAGPKAADLIETFRGVAGVRRPDDEAYMLRHLARTVYVGPFNICFYDPARAMCQQHVPIQERKAPITSHCQPDLCANSCVGKQHVEPLLGQLYEIKRLIKTPKLPVPQKIALVQEESRIERMVAPLVNLPEEAHAT